MTVKLVDNKQDKPNSQIWRWNWLTTNKTNQTRWLMTSEFGSSWWGIKRVWLITSEFVCLDRITSSSVSCWEQQSLTRKMFWIGWCGRCFTNEASNEICIAISVRKILSFVTKLMEQKPISWAISGGNGSWHGKPTRRLMAFVLLGQLKRRRCPLTN